jgi:hypothetical protein
MDKRVDRWFVRSQEHTLGPLTAAEIASRMKAGEILPSDKVYGAQEGSWKALSSHPLFAVSSSANQPKSSTLVVPPPPNVLWKKKRDPYSPPAAPPLPKEETVSTPAATPPPTEAKAAPTPAPAAQEKLQRAYAKESFPDPGEVSRALKAALQEWALEEELIERHRKPAYELPVAPRPQFSAATLPASEPKPRHMETVILPEPKARQKNAEAPPKAAAPDRVIRIELKFPSLTGLSWVRAICWLATLAVMGFATYFALQDKTRDLKGFRLSDPSSPTTVPSPASDPIPPLKAPTRPQRE